MTVELIPRGVEPVLEVALDGWLSFLLELIIIFWSLKDYFWHTKKNTDEISKAFGVRQ